MYVCYGWRCTESCSTRVHFVECIYLRANLATTVGIPASVCVSLAEDTSQVVVCISTCSSVSFDMCLYVEVSLGQSLHVCLSKGRVHVLFCLNTDANVAPTSTPRLSPSNMDVFGNINDCGIYTLHKHGGCIFMQHFWQCTYV